MAYEENGKCVCGECATEKANKVPKDVAEQIDLLGNLDEEASIN